MSEQSPEQRETDQTAHDEPAGAQDKHGSLSVEDDPDGTTDPASLAGSATPNDATVGYQPSSSEADKL